MSAQAWAKVYLLAAMGTMAVLIVDIVPVKKKMRHTESLRRKVKAVRDLSIEIGHEVKTHNKLLAEMESQFDSTTGFLGRTMGKLKILSRGSQTKLMCYMMLFSLSFLSYSGLLN